MTSVTRDQILRWRLRRHHLADDKAKDPVEAARRLSGVHAQVAASAVAAIDLRVARPVTARTVDKLLYEDRRLVRTWAARGAAGHKARVSRPQGWISPTLVVDGWIRGVWDADGDRPRVTPFAPLPATVAQALRDHGVAVGE
jgi:hypothetical protein